MINIESAVFDAVRSAIIAQYPTCYVTSTIVRVAPTLPAVTIIEADNTAYRKTQDTGSIENHAVIVYEVNVYSNAKNAKAQAKGIMTVVDSAFANLGYTRNMCNPIPNYDDATIYRIIARYRGIVGSDGAVYRK